MTKKEVDQMEVDEKQEFEEENNEEDDNQDDEDYEESIKKKPKSKSEKGGMSVTSNDYDAKLSEDRAKRFGYLLKQTEIFSHFMTSGTQGECKDIKPKPGRKPKGKDTPKESSKEDSELKHDNLNINDHRHRKTEQEEDEELLSESKKSVNFFR